MRSKTPLTIEETGLGRLARACYHKRKMVLAIWILGLILINVLGFAVGGGIFQDKFGGGNSESQQAQNLLKARFPERAGDTANVVFHTTAAITDPSNRATIEQIDQQVAKVPHVVSVLSPFAPGGEGQTSRDGLTSYSVIQFDKVTQDLPKKDMKTLVDLAKTSTKPGFEVEMGGAPIAKAETAPFGASEIVGIWAAIIILLIAFGSVIAMGLPIMTALFGIGIAVGVIEIFSHIVVVPTFGTELAAMIGIGVGIDYALFIVTRYRTGLHDGLEPEDAVIKAIGTSGRAVVFAGCTVIISLLGMLLLGLQFIYGLAFGAIAAVLLVMAGAMTLLPAVLGFCGRAIDKLHLPKMLHKGIGEKKTMAYRWSRGIQRYKVIAALGSFVVLVVLSLPLFGMHLAFTDAGNDPASFTTRKAYDLLAQGFGPGTNGPLVLAVSLSNAGDRSALPELAGVLAHDPDIAFVVPPQVNTAGNTAILIAIPKTSPQDQATQTLVHRIRNTIVPQATSGTGAKALVGGVTAAAVDSSAMISKRLFIVIGGVVILSFLLLMAVFRSVAVPLKAAIMNLLSVGAAYGVIVAVFQWGWGGQFFNIGKTGPIDPWIPLMLFTILFGLSMDYEVFLLSRIREEYLKTHDNATSVADGLAATARVITAAAAIMVCVFGSFVLGDLRILKVFGMGLATAVLVDATLVRMILVPATMELLGDANWWFPNWLDKAVPNISVETAPEPEPALAGAGAAPAGQ
jgi:RND superfamily putative drug exporter